MAFEKFYPIVGPVLFTQVGTVGGIAAVESTKGFKVKMPIILELGGVKNVDYEVKRVLDETHLVLGPRGERIDCVVNLTGFPLGAAIYAVPSRGLKRPDIPLNEISRWVYEEEPTVALRTVGVDEFGRKISSRVDSDGNIRLAVDASFTTSDDSEPVPVEIKTDGVNGALSTRTVCILQDMLIELIKIRRHMEILTDDHFHDFEDEIRNPRSNRGRG